MMRAALVRGGFAVVCVMGFSVVALIFAWKAIGEAARAAVRALDRYHFGSPR